MDNIRFDLLAALPEIIIATMAMVVLLIDLFLTKQNRIWIYALTQLTLVGAAATTFLTHSPEGGSFFTGMFVDDPLADVVKLFMYLGTSLILVYTRTYLSDRGMFRGEFYALVLFALLGMMMMVSGQNFLTLYIGLELLSLSLYALVAMDRDNGLATEAAMKYFVLGALASGMLLYGMSMVYGMTSSLNIFEISHVLQAQDTNHEVLVLGLVFIVAGLAFKLGAVPFQMWVPDVYHGSPTAITILIGTVPKLAAFVFIVRILVQALPAMAFDWQMMLIIMAVLSIALGNITAIAQTNIKRMLAYSTISHVGFILLGIMSANKYGMTSALFYVVAYTLMSLAAFGMILLLARKGFEATELDDLKGLSQRSPWHAFLMLIVMFSMAGVPPTIGFYAKFAILQATLAVGFTAIAVFAVVMAAIGAFYYLRVIKFMYFDQPEQTTPITAPMEMRVALGVNALALLVIGLMPKSLMDLCYYAMMQTIG